LDVKPKRVSTLALWDATICSVVIMISPLIKKSESSKTQCDCSEPALLIARPNILLQCSMVWILGALKPITRVFCCNAAF